MRLLKGESPKRRLHGRWVWACRCSMDGETVFQPRWFPISAAVSVDSKCNFPLKLRDPQGRETQKLVEFIDATAAFARAHCELLGTFINIPQLKKLVTDLGKQGKYNGRQSYVLRVNWSDTFALIRIVREDKNDEGPLKDQN